MAKYPESGISMIIAGGGIAGLVTALEATRNGHKVTVLESRPTNDPHGDFIVLGPNAWKFLRNWPHLKHEFDQAAFDAVQRWSKHSGEDLYGPITMPERSGKIMVRPKVHKMLMDEVKSQGIELLCNMKVVKYFEKDNEAGVEMEDGRIMVADVVVASDGVHSRSWRQVVGSKDEPQSSGHSAFRAAMPTSHAFANVLVKEKFGPQNNMGKDAFWFFLGLDTHAVVAAGKETVCWVLIHKDSAGAADESWNNLMSPDEALRLVYDQKNWDPAFLALVHQTKEVNDNRLMWRNPQAKTVSDGGRVIQIGDAAHSFLPTSANGAAQAIEDAVSLPACLRLAGKQRIPLGLKVHSKLRFERVSCAQKTGLMNRESLHKTDWAAVEREPSILSRVGPGNWIAAHDAEEYAITKFDDCARHVLHGTSFENTNFPEGYVYEPWDIKQLMRDADEGKRIVEKGNWN